jgi:MoaA/NifB/PqqE/SkfB family radical SAM enzyme
MLPQSVVRARVGLAMLFYNWFKIRRPITSQILVTKYCNYNCKQCFVYPMEQREKIQKTKEPTLEMLEYLFDESCKAGAQVIIPFGGEPLMRPDIGRVIRAIKERNRYCLMYTNGAFVPERIDELLLLDQLVISIDGPPETHERIRGKGSYQKAIDALEAALDHGLVCRLHTCLISETMDSLPHMIELSKKYDVMLNYGYCDATGYRQEARDEIELDRGRVVRFLKDLREAKASGGVKIASPIRAIDECIRVMGVWPKEGTILSKQEERQCKHLHIPKCALPFSNIYIDSDGCAYPCLPLWGKDGKPGPNVYELGLKKCWDVYKDLDCHQCASVFTIEKGFFYSFNLGMLLEYISGYEFLRMAGKPKRRAPQ